MSDIAFDFADELSAIPAPGYGDNFKFAHVGKRIGAALADGVVSASLAALRGGVHTQTLNVELYAAATQRLAQIQAHLSEQGHEEKRITAFTVAAMESYAKAMGRASKKLSARLAEGVPV